MKQTVDLTLRGGDVRLTEERPVMPARHSALIASLLQSPEARQMLMNELAQVSATAYSELKDSFIRSLDPLNREVYRIATETPYAAKDWWRDAHDIYVTWALEVIVREENQKRLVSESGVLLPEWLITAALLHDRGYAILAAQDGDRGRDYVTRQGAFWENADTRIQHALLSRQFAERLFADPKGGSLSERILPEDRDSFLSVIELHDYPLIGRYEELSEPARHHFDADSLYSLSVISFVKDYLSYAGDVQKLAKVDASGLCAQGSFLPRTLLAIRMARYFSSPDQLPVGWDSEEFPLLREAASYGEGGRLMNPVSEVAWEMTRRSFERLAECCRALESSESLAEFLPQFRHSFGDQFQDLRVRALEHRSFVES